MPAAWESLSELANCVQFLRNYIHVARLPAFLPYHWCCRGKLDPRQECIIIISYLNDHGQAAETQLLQYLLSEVLDVFEAEPDANDLGPAKQQDPSTHDICWQVLRQFYRQIQAGKTRTHLTDSHKLQLYKDKNDDEQDKQDECDEPDDAEMKLGPHNSIDQIDGGFGMENRDNPFEQQQQSQSSGRGQPPRISQDPHGYPYTTPIDKTNRQSSLPTPNYWPDQPHSTDFRQQQQSGSSLDQSAKHLMTPPNQRESPEMRRSGVIYGVEAILTSSRSQGAPKTSGGQADIDEVSTDWLDILAV
jgi:hypothetical protein